MNVISKMETFTKQDRVPFSAMRLVTGFIVALWFLTVLILGSRQWFVRPAGSLPIPILMAVTIPVVLYLSAFRISDRFREFVLTADLRLITGVQAWRFGGFAFLVLYALKLLPAYFAWPAGLGDMAIGATAPFLVAKLWRDPHYAASKNFRIWNVLGILDLFTAVTLGGLGPFLFSNVGLTAAPLMARLPLSLIPTFFVPLFILLHLSALFRGRRL